MIYPNGKVLNYSYASGLDSNISRELRGHHERRSKPAWSSGCKSRTRKE